MIRKMVSRFPLYRQTGKAVREKLTPQKTDENGNRYIEMADGSRVYVTKSKGVSVN